ncbi:restriction endonuclease subunit S [Sinorhizobium meliloti]|nr:restriction endonuclease subunit S [Sinorhizobium meliloti]
MSRIARQETGHTPSRSHPEWWDGDIPWIGIKDAGAHHGRIIEETIQTTNEEGLANSAARLLPAGTVCLSRTASVGYVTIMGKPMATSQDFVTWTCTEALVPKFLMYALMAEGDDIREFGKGTTHTTIYFPEVRAMQICLAPLEEQHEIARRIEAAFAKIDRLAKEAKRALELVGRLDEAILAKAFRGELVPQDENDEPAEKLLERIRSERQATPKAGRGRGKV